MINIMLSFILSTLITTFTLNEILNKENMVGGRIYSIDLYAGVQLDSEMKRVIIEIFGEKFSNEMNNDIYGSSLNEMLDGDNSHDQRSYYIEYNGIKLELAYEDENCGIILGFPLGSCDITNKPSYDYDGTVDDHRNTVKKGVLEYKDFQKIPQFKLKLKALNALLIKIKNMTRGKYQPSRICRRLSNLSIIDEDEDDDNDYASDNDSDHFVERINKDDKWVDEDDDNNYLSTSALILQKKHPEFKDVFNKHLNPFIKTTHSYPIKIFNIPGSCSCCS